MDRVRQIHFYKDYFLDFYEKQTPKVREKIDHVLYVVSVADRIPAKFLQHITGTKGLYEIRIEFSGNIYRIFSCFDQGNVVVLFNGFQKKSQKAPGKEIDKALTIMKHYFDEKSKRHDN